jgi:hypothetical protein
MRRCSKQTLCLLRCCEEHLIFAKRLLRAMICFEQIKGCLKKRVLLVHKVKFSSLRLVHTKIIFEEAVILKKY